MFLLVLDQHQMQVHQLLLLTRLDQPPTMNCFHWCGRSFQHSTGHRYFRRFPASARPPNPAKTGSRGRRERHFLSEQEAEARLRWRSLPRSQPASSRNHQSRPHATGLRGHHREEPQIAPRRRRRRSQPGPRSARIRKIFLVAAVDIPGYRREPRPARQAPPVRETHLPCRDGNRREARNRLWPGPSPMRRPADTPPAAARWRERTTSAGLPRHL